ncbi:protein of unknown function [Lactiplantibacillus plantarum]
MTMRLASQAFSLEKDSTIFYNDIYSLCSSLFKI